MLLSYTRAALWYPTVVAVSRLVCFVVGYTFIRGFFLEALGNRMVRDEKCSQKH